MGDSNNGKNCSKAPGEIKNDNGATEKQKLVNEELMELSLDSIINTRTSVLNSDSASAIVEERSSITVPINNGSTDLSLDKLCDESNVQRNQTEQSEMATDRQQIFFEIDNKNNISSINNNEELISKKRSPKDVGDCLPNVSVQCTECKQLNTKNHQLRNKISELQADLVQLKTELETKKVIQVPSYREKVLLKRLVSQEQQIQQYVNQLKELKASQIPSVSQMRNALLDPAVNILYQKLKKELITVKANLEETQNELNAWKFTPDSNTGKRLMAKCRLLHQENEELGKIVSSGRLAKLEGELALQKTFSNEIKKSQSELDEFLQDLDEDVEGMQGTIYYLQQELKKSTDIISNLQNENRELRKMTTSPNEIALSNPSTATEINDCCNLSSLEKSLSLKEITSLKIPVAEDSINEKTEKDISIDIHLIIENEDKLTDITGKNNGIEESPAAKRVKTDIDEQFEK